MKKERSPLQWLYLRIRSGKEVNFAVLSRKVDKYLKDEELNFFLKVLKASNSIAISARALKESVKRRYRDNHLTINGRHFYVFSKLWQPADIFIKLHKDKYIYETLDGDNNTDEFNFFSKKRKN